MALSLGMITFDSLNPIPLAHWWAEQLGGEVLAENDGWFVVVRFQDTPPLLAFQKVEDPTPGKNRIHVDFNTANLDAEVARLLAAGATHVSDQSIDGNPWVVLADPDGNQFCVVLDETVRD